MPNTWLLGHNHGNRLRNNGVYTSRTESETLLCTKSAFKKLFLFLALEHLNYSRLVRVHLRDKQAFLNNLRDIVGNF